MKRIFLICILLTMISSCALAKQITATGYGATATEAENDALRNAVENVMGTLIDSQTLVDKNVVVEDEIYSQSRGFVQNYNVQEKRQDIDGNWKVVINAEVDTNPNSQLMNQLTKMGLIVNNLRNAKIAVIIPEQHLRYRIPDPAGETAVIKKFVDAGFPNIIDMSRERISYNKPFNLDGEQLANLASTMQADILVVGEAFSEGVGDIGQFIGQRGKRTGAMSCKARVEAKMYIARTGQIIAADGTYGAAMDTSEAIASKKALQAAGEKMGDYLIEKLLNRASGNQQFVELVVIANDINTMNRLKMVLGSVAGVKNVNFNNYANGKGIMSVQYSGAPQTLFSKLQAEADFNLELREATYNTLTVQVR